MFRQAVIIALVLSLQVFVSASDELNSEDDRIVGGNIITIDKIPHQVSLQFNGNHFCGGSLLNDQFILTAAHCLDFVPENFPNLQVVLGTSYYGKGGIKRKLAGFAKHPWYNNKTIPFDIGLVKMIEPVTFSSNIKPIVMAETVPENLAGCIVSGWGYQDQNKHVSSPELRVAYLNFYRREACSQPPNRYPPKMIQEMMVCAGADGRGSCQGDSGGPLMEVDTKRLVGIVSWGFDCAQTGYPTVYTSVPCMRKWIDKTMDRMRKI